MTTHASKKTNSAIQILAAMMILCLIALASGCADGLDNEQDDHALEQRAAIEALMLKGDAWMMLDETTPGVYYRRVAGGCPHGGAWKRGGCLIAHINDADVDYRFDLQRAEPGVYYDLVDGACPHGGVPLGDACKLAPLLPDEVETPDALD